MLRHAGQVGGLPERDSGTLNPFRHGEVFVLDDGMECDMDLGTYERVLNQNLSHLNFTTSGQIFSSVLAKERAGRYLGRDVQMIPHVTGEVKLRLRELALTANADVVFVEIGGTVGDVENAYFIEAVREMAHEEGAGNFCFVALTYIVEPETLHEQKSKPAQLNLKLLNAAGIHPHIIGCRATNPVTRKVREKIAMFATVPPDRVFSLHDCDSVYVVPEMLRGAGIDAAVLDLLELSDDELDEAAERKSLAGWSEYIKRFRTAAHPITIGIIGKYTSLRDSYASIIQALEHAGTHLGAKVRLEWVDSSDLTLDNVAARLKDIHGIIVPGGFGVRGVDGKICCIEYAREVGIPYLGLCYGMQIAVIEFARNVAKLEDANSTEIDLNCTHPVVDILPEQKEIEGLGGNMRLGGYDIEVKPGTLAERMFGARTRVRFRHRYEVDPRYVEQLEAAGMIFSGKAPKSELRNILELPAEMHPFFVGTQGHPELTSRPLRPQPFFLGFVHAALQHAYPDFDNVLEYPAQTSENGADTPRPAIH
jgi:CTP synthase